MPLHSVLLRLLLALALVCQGVAPAWAAARTHVVAGAAPMADCHVVAGHATAGATTPAPMPADTHQAGHCCDGGACQCTCATAAFVLLPRMVAGAPVAMDDDVLQRRVADHRAPALAHPIRPPIA
ncbi:MAG: CopL family metal-binding regulatory protein [Arenimonas sp.]